MNHQVTRLVRIERDLAFKPEGGLHSVFLLRTFECQRGRIARRGPHYRLNLDECGGKEMTAAQGVEWARTQPFEGTA